MSQRIKRSFFASREVVFVGYSRREKAFSEAVKTAFEKAGAKVYPVNPQGGEGGVFRSIDEVPARPELAYVLTSKANAAGALQALAAKGVKRVAFQSKRSADETVLARCAELGMEAVVACPMMALGGGLHRFHGFLAGVRA